MCLTFVVIFEINFSSSYQNAAAIIQAAWRIYQHKKILEAREKEVRKNLLFCGAYLLIQASNFPLFSFPRKYNIFENPFSKRVRHRLDNLAFFRKHGGLATAKYRFLHNHEIGPLKKNRMYKLGPSCSKGNLRRPGIKQ